MPRTVNLSQLVTSTINHGLIATSTMVYVIGTMVYVIGTVNHGYVASTVNHGRLSMVFG